MKKLYFFLFIILNLCTTISAQIIFDEPFTYLDGNLESSNLGTGFTTAWSNTTTGNTGANTLAQIVSNKLQVSLPTGVSTTVRYDRAIPLTLNGDASTQEYWLGYWLRIPAANLSTSTYGVTAQVILMNGANSTLATDMRLGYGKTSNYASGVNSANAVTMFTRASPAGCAAVNWPSAWNTASAAQQASIGLSTTTDNLVYVLVNIKKGEFLNYQTPSAIMPNPNPIGNFDGYRIWVLSSKPTSPSDAVFTTFPNGHVSFIEAITMNSLPIQTKVLRGDHVNGSGSCVKDGISGIRIRVEGNPGATPFFAEFDEIRLAATLTDVLPIKLENFSASQSGKSNILNWATATEADNKGFHIEQSSNGTTWKSICFVQGANNSSDRKEYSFTDNNPYGTTFYRLSQEDFDGKISYSNIEKVKRSNNLAIDISPNPAQDFIKITLNKSSNNNAVNLLDIQGRKVLSTKFNGYKNSINIASLPKGIYFINIVTENGTTVQKFVKQ